MDESDEVVRLEARVQALEDALRFYADERNCGVRRHHAG
jgi:hypothetical protein